MPPILEHSRFCYRLCQHIKTNGVQCQSPALRDTNFCYFHGAMNRQRRQSDPFLLPALEDANAIQIAVQEVIEALLEKRIDNKRAGLLLYALQIASANLKRVNFEPYTLRDRAIREHDRQYYAELEKHIASGSPKPPQPARPPQKTTTTRTTKPAKLASAPSRPARIASEILAEVPVSSGVAPPL
jgi:hypothetical protein